MNDSNTIRTFLLYAIYNRIFLFDAAMGHSCSMRGRHDDSHHPKRKSDTPWYAMRALLLRESFLASCFLPLESASGLSLAATSLEVKSPSERLEDLDTKVFAEALPFVASKLTVRFKDCTCVFSSVRTPVVVSSRKSVEFCRRPS